MLRLSLEKIAWWWFENIDPTKNGVMKIPRIFEAVAEHIAAGTFPFAIDVNAIDDCTVDGKQHKKRMPIHKSGNNIFGNK